MLGGWLRSVFVAVGPPGRGSRRRCGRQLTSPNVKDWFVAHQAPALIFVSSYPDSLPTGSAASRSSSRGPWSLRPAHIPVLRRPHRCLRLDGADRLAADDADRLLAVQRGGPGPLRGDVRHPRPLHRRRRRRSTRTDLPRLRSRYRRRLLAGGGTGTEVALFVAACCLVSLIVVLTARETPDVATEELGGLRGRPAVTPAEAVAGGRR